jgi:hypothetical protein
VPMSLSYTTPQADAMRTALVAALARPVPAGSPSGLECKRLAYLSAAVVEMPAASVRAAFAVPLLAELEALFPHPSRQVRRSLSLHLRSWVLSGSFAVPLLAELEALFPHPSRQVRRSLSLHLRSWVLSGSFVGSASVELRALVLTCRELFFPNSPLCPSRGVPTHSPAGYTGDGSRADAGIPPAALRSSPLAHSLTGLWGRCARRRPSVRRICAARCVRGGTRAVTQGARVCRHRSPPPPLPRSSPGSWRTQRPTSPRWCARCVPNSDGAPCLTHETTGVADRTVRVWHRATKNGP